MFCIKRAVISMVALVNTMTIVLLSSISAMAQTTAPGNILNQPVLGEYKILLVRVQYPGDAGGIVSDADMRNIAAVIKETLETNSYGTITLTTDITPVLEMPQPDSYYRFDESTDIGLVLVRIRADAIALAQQSGYPEANYDRVVIYTKKLWNSLAVGLGTVNFRTLFVACGCDYLTLHELGHSFDWKHANFWRVRQGSPTSPDGEELNYGDAFDIMGDQIPGRGRSFHHFNPWFKSRAGWLPDANILTVKKNGTYTIQAIEKMPDAQSPVQKFSAFRIKKDAATDYWVFYRSQEEFANTGALITMGFRSNKIPSRLLDMTPGNRNDEWKDAALTVGKIFYDSDSGVEIKLLSKTSDELTLQVFVPPDTAGSVPALDVVQPSTGKILSGMVRYEVTAFDPDFNASNGAGITRLKLELENTLAEGSAQIFASAELTAPPYFLDVDTKNLSDDVYFLLVTAMSADGDSNTIRFPHIIDNTGPSFPASVAGTATSSPDAFQLLQNYPNPFNPSTTIQFSLFRKEQVTLQVFDVLGREVANLLDAELSSGEHAVVFDAKDLTSGVYLFRLTAGRFTKVRKALFVK